MKEGKEQRYGNLHLLFIRFSYFSLICLYRNRDILVNVLKRKRQTWQRRVEYNAESTITLNLFSSALYVSYFLWLFLCGISCTVALVKLIRLIRYENH